jgi:hypothetical protein
MVVGGMMRMKTRRILGAPSVAHVRCLEKRMPGELIGRHVAQDVLGQNVDVPTNSFKEHRGIHGHLRLDFELLRPERPEPKLGAGSPLAALVESGDRGDLGAAVRGGSGIADRVEGEQHVLGRQRNAVVPGCLRVDGECVGLAVRRDLPLAGQRRKELHLVVFQAGLQHALEHEPDSVEAVGTVCVDGAEVVGRTPHPRDHDQRRLRLAPDPCRQQQDRDQEDRGHRHQPHTD